VSTFVEIFRFELAHRVRHWSMGLYFAVMAGTVWLLLIDLMIGESAGSSGVHANAPATVAMAMTIGTMVMLIATAGLFGEAAARDVESRMHSLLYAMPLSKRGYLAGRFFGAFTLNALLLVAGTIGLLFVEAERGGASTASFGAFRPMAYAGAYLLVALPTLFATGAIVFACAALTGRTVAGYGAAAFLFLGPSLGRSLIGSDAAGKFLGALLEPFAFDALGQSTEYWTAFETNTRLVPLTGALLWNRVVWVAAGAAVLAFTHFRFRFADGARRRNRDERRRATTLDALTQSSAPIVVPNAPQSFAAS
jgi:ABC-type transport system involved in multi-copper enzyme maturation permease subunit